MRVYSASVVRTVYSFTPQLLKLARSIQLRSGLIQSLFAVQCARGLSIIKVDVFIGIII